MRRRLTQSFIILIAVVAASCSSRMPAQIGVDANYVIEVTNPATHPMAVSLDLGANQMSALGSVEAGQTKRFEIRDPATNDIYVIGIDSSGQHRTRKKVELKRGTISQVTLN